MKHFTRLFIAVFCQTVNQMKKQIVVGFCKQIRFKNIQRKQQNSNIILQSSNNLSCLLNLNEYHKITKRLFDYYAVGGGIEFEACEPFDPLAAFPSSLRGFLYGTGALFFT
jgi:hypothetical protein